MVSPEAYCFYMMRTAWAEAMVSIGGAVEHGQSSYNRPMHTLHHRRYRQGHHLHLALSASPLLTTLSTYSKPIYHWKALTESFQNHIGFAMFR